MERPLTAQETLGYLERHQIPVELSKGVLFTDRPASMDRDVYLDHIAYVGRYLKRHKEAIIAHFEGGGCGWVDSTPPVDWNQVRRDTTTELRELAQVSGMRMSWYSSYDQSTGYLRPELKWFPKHATHARVEPPEQSRDGLPVPLCIPHMTRIAAGETVYPTGGVWLYLPWSTPRQKKSRKQGMVYRTPWWWKPPPNWCRPQKWIPQPKPKALIRKAWAEKWKHREENSGELPD